MKRYIKYAALMLVGLLGLTGCGQEMAVTVNLETPTNGGTVSSLTPILAWDCNYADATYRLQVSEHGNFQDLIIDESNLTSPSYTVASGKLDEAKTYYWKVNATKGGQVSSWTEAWAFQTPGSSPPPPEPGYGTIVVNATLDGAAWTGGVNYTLSGPDTYSGSSATQSFSNAPAGTYTLGYNSGGPAGVDFSNVAPSSTQTLTENGTITFTLNFETGTTTALRVNATLDGASWTGKVNYTVTGPEGFSGSSVEQTFSNVASGSYTVGYNSGGPSGATLASISPHPTQSVVSGHTTTFTLNFHSENTSSIRVKATLDGSTWTGSVNYTLDGPYSDTHGSVSETFNNLPVGTYTLVYNHGGPPGATLTSITPQPTQTTSADQRTTFTMNFVSQAASTVNVRATLDGESWSGSVLYNISGPYRDADTTVPLSLTNLPAGTYTLSYRSGGPSGATLSDISPSPTQSVSTGHSITFTLHFHSQATGTIEVNALLDGQSWETAVGSGTIRYGISGPVSDSSTSMPDTFSGLPSGSYTLTYHDGGPVGATLISISPQPTQNLPAGGNITYTLNFHSEPRGSVMVNATLNGSDWEGDVSYTLNGPYVDSHGSVPYTFDNCPGGSYTLSYNSGGPGALQSITPSPSQQLPDGGAITFTLNFEELLQ